MPVLLLSHIIPFWDWASTQRMFRSNEGYLYPYTIPFFAESMLAGNFLPRWMPELSGGLGSPRHYLYPPGYWYVSTPFYLLTGNAMLAFYLACSAWLTLGAAGMYRLARLYTNHIPASACALFFLVMPYMLFLVFNRGRFSEVSAICLLPWYFYFLARFWQRIETGRSMLKYGCMWSFTAAATIYCHPFTAFWLTAPSLAIFLAHIWHTQNRLRVTYATLLFALLAIALASPFWLAFLQVKDQVNFPVWRRFISRDFTTVLHDAPGIGGSLMLLFSFALCCLPGKKISAPSRGMLLSLGTTALLLMMYQTPQAEVVYRTLHFLPYTQNSRRTSGIIVVLIPWITAIIWREVSQWKKHGGSSSNHAMSFALFMVVMALGMYGVSQQRSLRFFSFPHFQEKSHNSWAEMTHGNRPFSPHTARHELTFQRNRFRLPITDLECQDSGARIERNNSEHMIEARLFIPQNTAPCVLLVRQWHFPGWRMQLNGQDVAIAPSPSPASSMPNAYVDANGMMRLAIPAPGEYAVRAWHDGPPHWRLRNAIIVFIGGAVLLLARRIDVRTSRHA